MHVLVTGASGHIAAAVIPELLSAGHTVTGLARSDRSAATVRALGAQVRRGDLEDLDGLGDAARQADAVVHLAFKNAEQREGDLAGAVSSDIRAIEAIGTALAGSGKPFIGTNATGAFGLAGFSGTLTEEDCLPDGPRIDSENAVVALAERDVRAAVVRLPPTVHSDGRYGFATGLIDVARSTGVSGYAGDGENRWSSADTRDVAVLYRLALESASPGSRLHAVAEEGIALRDIAEAIARRTDTSPTSVPGADVEQHFGFLSAFVVLDNPASSHITRETLGWTPSRPGLLDDLVRADEGTAA